MKGSFPVTERQGAIGVKRTEPFAPHLRVPSVLCFRLSTLATGTKVFPPPVNLHRCLSPSILSRSSSAALCQYQRVLLETGAAEAGTRVAAFAGGRTGAVKEGMVEVEEEEMAEEGVE